MLLFLISVLLQNAQNLQGIVEYQYKKSMKETLHAFLKLVIMYY